MTDDCQPPYYPLCLIRRRTEPLRVGPWTERDPDTQAITDVVSFTGFRIVASAVRGVGVSPPLWTRDSNVTSPYAQITLEDWTDPDTSTDYTDAIIIIHWGTDITDDLVNPTKHAEWELAFYDDGPDPVLRDYVLAGPYSVSLVTGRP